MAETIRKGKDGPKLGGKSFFALGVLKEVAKKGPAQEKRMLELEETCRNKNLVQRYGEKDIQETKELCRSSQANATHTEAIFYFYSKRGDEFVMENLLQYLRLYNKGNARKFLTEIAKETRQMKIPEDDKRLLGEIAKIALGKTDEQAVVSACIEFLNYIDRRHRKKGQEYSEAKELEEQVEMLREW